MPIPASPHRFPDDFLELWSAVDEVLREDDRS